jgi:hypothetical protein
MSGEDLEQTIMRCVALYNTQFPQSALGSRTPVQTMKARHKSNPELFVKKPRYSPGRNSLLRDYALTEITRSFFEAKQNPKYTHMYATENVGKAIQ